MWYHPGAEPVEGYRLLEFLGKGGFGEVWKAAGPGDIEVALKIIYELSHDKGGKELRALQLLKKIHHPNLVQIHGYWLKEPPDAESGGSMQPAGEDSELIIAMGLGEKNLYERLEECQRTGRRGIPSSELLHYMNDAAAAIDYLNHEHSIQHCDIKPQNILIVGGAAQVCDFGLAKAIGVNLKQTSNMAMSIAYGSPEVLKGELPTKTTDQYSLAISYYELLTGELPFSAENPGVAFVHAAKISGDLDFSKVNEDERAVLQRATAIEPGERYAKTRHLVKELTKCSFDPTASMPIVVDAELRDPRRARSPREIVPGYQLEQRLYESSDEEIWSATGPGRVSVSLISRTLRGMTDIDFETLTTAFELRHEHLSDPMAYWLLDARGDTISDDERTSVDELDFRKLVIVGRLVDRTLQDEIDDHVANGGSIALDHLLDYMKQIAAAVDFLNFPELRKSGDRRAGIQHCNLLPSNFVLSDGHVQVGNLCRVEALEGDSAPCNERLSRRDHPAVAPEIRGGKLTKWSDQYSLAVAYVQMRTGCPPDDALSLPGLSPPEAAVVKRALAKKPHRRFGNSREFVDALCEATADERSRAAEESSHGDNHAIFTQTLHAGAEPDLHKTMPVDLSLKPSGTFPAPSPSPRPLPAPTPVPWRRVGLVGLLCAALLTIGAGAWLFVSAGDRASHLSTEVRRLVNGGEYDAAGDRLHSAPAWFAWRVDGEALEEFGANAFESRLRRQIGMGELTEAESLLSSIPTWLEARLDEKALASLRSSFRGETTPDDMLTLVRSSVVTARERFQENEDPTQPLDAAQRQLDKLSRVRGLSAEQVRAVSDYQYQVHLVRARFLVLSGPADWSEVQSLLGELDRLRDTTDASDHPERQAIHTLLEVLVEQAEHPDGLARRVDLLAAHRRAMEVLNGAEGEWAPTDDERLRLKKVERETVAAVRTAIGSSEPETGVALADRLLALQGADASILELKSGHQVQLRQFEEALQTLKLAQQHAAPDRRSELAQQAQLLGALLSGLASGDAAKVQEAITTFDRSREQAPGSLRLGFTERLLELAEEDEGIRSLAMDYLERETGEYESLRPRFESLLQKGENRAYAERRLAVLQAAADPSSFETLMARLAELPGGYGNDVLMSLIQTECDLEEHPEQLNWPLAEKRAKRELAGGDADYQRYQQYIQARLLHAAPAADRETRRRSAAMLISQAFGAPAKLLDSSNRQSHAAEILVQAAAPPPRLSNEATFLSRLANPYRVEAQARHALDWLRLAEQLTQSELAETQRNRALAAARVPGADPAELMRLGTEALASSGGEPDLPLLFAYAQALGEDTSALDRLRPYATLAGQAKQTEAITQPEQLYELIVKPAISAADSISDPADLSNSDRRLVAGVYTQQGDMLRRHPDENWGFQADEVALAAYEKAIQFDPTSSRSFFGRGRMRYRLTVRNRGAAEPAGLHEALEDANKAIELRADFAGGHELRGQVLLRQSRGRTDLQRRLEELKMAADSCRDALDPNNTGLAKDQRANTLINLTNAIVERVSYDADLDRTQQRMLLEEARQHATAATQINSVWQDYAYRTLGNSVEDLAWIAKVAPAENYRAAIDAFTVAVNRGLGNEKSFLDRGRCQFKAVMYGGLDQDLLKTAVSDLGQAILRDPQLAEAYYWLGRVHFHRAEMTKNRSEFVTAFQNLKLASDKQPDGAPDFHYWKGRAAREMQKWTDVHASYLQAIAVALAGGHPPDRYLYHWAAVITNGNTEPSQKQQFLEVVDSFAGRQSGEAKLAFAVAKELEGNLQEAASGYDDALAAAPASVAQRDLQETIYIRYVQANFHQLSQLKQQSPTQAAEYAAKHSARVLAVADRAAKHVQEPEDLLMVQVYGAQTRSLLAQVGPADTKNRLFQGALEIYAGLIQKHPAHPNRWFWMREAVVFQLYFLPANLDTPEKQNLAKKQIREALNLAPGDQKTMIRRIRDDLGRRFPN